jgi:integrase
MAFTRRLMLRPRWRVFGAGVRILRLEHALIEAMLAGWRSQQAARYLKSKTIRANEAGVRAFGEHVGCWPWEWRATHADEYFEDLLARPQRLARSTLRAYQQRLRGFSEYVCDRLPVVGDLRARIRPRPGTAVRRAQPRRASGRLRGRPAPAAADRRGAGSVLRRVRGADHEPAAGGRNGSLQAWQDHALLKVMFAWGLRRAEVAMLDLCDFRPAHKLPEFGAYGQLHVRYDTAKRALQGLWPRRADRGQGDVLLHAQPLTRTAAPKTSDITVTKDGTVTVELARGAVPLPEPLAALSPALRYQRLAATGAEGWLLPGRKGGTHITADRLRDRLQRYDITSRPSRRAALLALAGRLPAPILAERLGVHQARAAQWVRTVGAIYSDYVALRMTP